MKTSFLETITRMGSIFDAGTVGWKTRSRSSMCNEQGQFLFCHVNCKASEVVVFKEGKEKINTTFCWDICKPHKQSGTILQQWGMTDLHCVIIHSCMSNTRRGLSLPNVSRGPHSLLLRAEWSTDMQQKSKFWQISKKLTHRITVARTGGWFTRCSEETEGTISPVPTYCIPALVARSLVQ